MQRATLFLIPSAILLFGVSSIPQPTHAATLQECQQINSRFRPATADDPAVRNGQVRVGDCYDPNDRGIGATEEAAKQELERMWCNGRANRCGAYVSSMSQLDPKFAVCAAKFLTEVRQRDPSICIVSAFRSADHQRALCSGNVCGNVSGPCAAPGQSKHQSGRAIDIYKPGSNTIPGWVHQMARQSGNISFPVRNDDGHMEPANVDAGDCATAGFIAPGNGKTTPSPTSQFTQAVRQALGMQPAQQAAPAQQATPSQPLAQSQSPLSSFDSSVSKPLVSDSLLSSSPLSTTTPIADRLEQLAFNRPASTSPTSVAVPLVINPNDRGGVTSAPRPNEGTGVAWIGAGITQNTFSQQAPTPSYAAPTNATTYQTILMSLRNILQTMLVYLRPFGRQQSAEIHFE